MMLEVIDIAKLLSENDAVQGKKKCNFQKSEFIFCKAK